MKTRKEAKTIEADYVPAAAPRFGQHMARFTESPRAKNGKATLRRLLGFYMSEGKLILAAFFLLVGSSALLLAAPFLISRAVSAIDAAQGFGISGGFGDAARLAVIILFVYIADWLFNTGQGLIMAGVSQKIVRNLRAVLFDKLRRLPLTYHDANPHGEVMSRITNDIDNVSVTIAASTSQLMSAAVTVVGSAVFMFLLSPPLASVTLIILPLVLGLAKILTSKARGQFAGQQEELGRLNSIIEESVSGLRVIKAFRGEERFIGKFKETNGALLLFSTKAQIISGFLMPFMNVITNIGFVFVVGLGGYLALRGDIAVGVIAGFVTYSRLFARPLNDIASTLNLIQSALAGAERVFGTLEEREKEPDTAEAAELVSPCGHVEFRNVGFSYSKGGARVLRNVSFEAKPGQTVAIVGKTGAGKTTVVNLLTRFHEADEGEILIDGGNIRAYTRESLMRAFTVVLQDSHLFTGTIADNIRYGKPDASAAEIVAAASLANAHAFIKRLPQGYDTSVSGSSDSLSQGQLQLLAIARAVLRHAPILILDEATSSVDTSTELKIQEALRRFRSGRTSFVIAHRLSTIRDADVILVMDGGEIIEKGTHEELLSLGGRYAEMVRG